MQIRYITSSGSSNPLRKLLALLVTLALFALLIMFSAVALAVLLLVALLGGVYLWWKTRAIRRQMRDFPLHEMAREQAGRMRGDRAQGEVIEGEVIRVHESDTVRSRE